MTLFMLRGRGTLSVLTVYGAWVARMSLSKAELTGALRVSAKDFVATQTPARRNTGFIDPRMSWDARARGPGNMRTPIGSHRDCTNFVGRKLDRPSRRCLRNTNDT